MKYIKFICKQHEYVNDYKNLGLNCNIEGECNHKYLLYKNQKTLIRFIRGTKVKKARTDIYWDWLFCLKIGFNFL